MKLASLNSRSSDRRITKSSTNFWHFRIVQFQLNCQIWSFRLWLVNLHDSSTKYHSVKVIFLEEISFARSWVKRYWFVRTGGSNLVPSFCRDNTVAGWLLRLFAIEMSAREFSSVEWQTNKSAKLQAAKTCFEKLTITRGSLVCRGIARRRELVKNST